MEVVRKETTIVWHIYDGKKEYRIRRTICDNEAPVTTYHVYETPYGWRQLISRLDEGRAALEALEATLT